MYDFPNSTTVTVLAGTELIFFLEACMMLWFRFLMKIALITHQCFQLLQSSAYTFNDRLSCPTSKEAGRAQKAGRRHSQTQTDQARILYQIESCSAIKARVKGGRTTFGIMAFVIPRNRYSRWALFSWKWLNTCLLMGNEWTPCFALIACGFYFTLWTVLISTHEFLHFNLLNSLPHPSWG